MWGKFRLFFCIYGVSSLYAVTEGASKIWACETNKYMFNVAQNVIAANNMSEKINVINESSMQLAVPTDIPNKYKYCFIIRLNYNSSVL